MALDDIQQAAFEKTLESISERFGGLRNAIESMQKQTDLAADGLRNSSEINKNYSRLLKERNAQESVLLRAQRDGRATAAETTASLKALNEAVMTAIPPELQSSFSKLAKGNSVVTAGTIYFQKVLIAVTPTLSLFGAAVKGLIDIHQGGATEMEAATNGFTLGVNTLIGGSKILSNGLSSVGAAAMSAAPGLLLLGPEMIPLVGIIEGLGAAASILGNVFGGLTDAADLVAKTAMPILNKELENNYRAFINITNSGGLFAHGLTDMLTATSALNLTLPQFDEVIRAESDNLSKLGLSVAGAAEKLGGVGAVLKRDKIDVALRNIGLSAKDQAAAIAETMAAMRQSGGLLTADNDEIAKETATYAQNLKLISAITGEDAKKKEAQVKEENTRLAFQQKLNTLEPKERARVIQAEQAMSDLNRKAFQQFFVFGNAVTPDIAYSVNAIGGLRDMVDEQLAALSSGELSGDFVRGTQEKYNQQIADSLQDQAAIAKAGLFGAGGVVGSVELLFGKELEFVTKATPEAIKTATDNINELFTKPDGVTTSMTKAAKAGQDLAVNLNNLSLDSGVLKVYADRVADMNNAMSDLIDKFLKGDGGEKTTGISQKEQEAIKSAIQDGKILTNAQIVELKAINETQLNALATKLGVSVDAIAKSAGFDSGTKLTNAQADFQIQQNFDQMNAANFANGGIVSGPTSGFPARLHGTEAIIPLPDGVSGPEFAQALQGLSRFSNATSDAAAAGSQLRDQLSNLSNDLLSSLNSKIDDLIYATQDVARYTKDTSVRIM
jgi:hypothetical protein